MKTTNLSHRDLVRSRNGLICKETDVAESSTGFCFRRARVILPKTNKPTDHCKLRFSIYDGPQFLARATVRSWEDYVDEVLEGNNECAVLNAIIRVGNEQQRTLQPGYRSHFYYWWYDFETQEDFITELIQDPEEVTKDIAVGFSHNPITDNDDDDDDEEDE